MPSDLGRRSLPTEQTLLHGGQEFRATFGFCHTGGGLNCVVDGDTFYLNGAKIRIAGIDAPETHDFDCPYEKALGTRATGRLQELLSGGALTLQTIDRDRDRYGRLLRNVKVDGRDVGDTLIVDGLARSYKGRKENWC
jgi:endonuclease YncB( thermonuclease family)